jgi:glutamine amidotransferase
MTRRVTIFDYGAGNLHSLAKALADVETIVRIEPDPVRAVDTDVLVLPGVGSFPQAADRLAPARDVMRAAILGDGLATLGICLGMQLLFDESSEGAGLGLGIIPGRVTRLTARRVPQIGWNTLDDVDDPIFDRAPLSIAYYAHSFACRPRDEGTVIAWSQHERDRFPAAVRAGTRGNVLGVQFHPEKSSQAGVRFVKTFLHGASASGAGHDHPAVLDAQPSALRPRHS